MATSVRNRKSVPNRVRELRAARLWTQEKLAQVAGVSVWTINRAELGKAGTSILVQEKIARAFGLTRKDVFPPEGVAA